MASWYRAGLDIDAHMPLLSTWLGHADPANSYWYLSATPELLALAVARRDQTEDVPLVVELGGDLSVNHTLWV